MEYEIEGSRYAFSYAALKEDYWRFRGLGDVEFIEELHAVLHFCCVVGFLKELPASCVLSDKGVIHQLVHLLEPSTKEIAFHELPEIRERFNQVFELV